MKPLTAAQALLVLLLMGSLPAFCQSWRTLRPGVTTETEILVTYGKPPNVTIRFVGFEAFEAWRKGTLRPTYDFEYFFPSSLDPVEGPLGEASEVTVRFGEDKKLVQVEWTYRSGMRLHLRTREGASIITRAQIEGLFEGNPLTKKVRRLSDETLYRYKRDGFVIDIAYLGEGGDILVNLTRNGTFAME